MPEHHTLSQEFPEYREAIHALKEGDAHFRRLFDEYHDLDREILRHEENVPAVSDEHMEELKKRRLELKDQLFGMLRAVA